jgi:hypothetical protein
MDIIAWTYGSIIGQMKLIKLLPHLKNNYRTGGTLEYMSHITGEMLDIPVAPFWVGHSAGRWVLQRHPGTFGPSSQRKSQSFGWHVIITWIFLRSKRLYAKRIHGHQN